MRTLRTLDLNLLKAFNALMEERSVSKAAERLSITQPAMSGILLRLRASFDDPLFVRIHRGIEPTNKAIALACPIKKILDQIESLLSPAPFIPEQSELIVNIACTDYALQAIITPFLIHLRKQAPNIKIAIFNINENSLQEQLEKRQIDFALTTPNFQAPDIHARILYQEEYVCAMRKNHPLAKKKQISLKDFCLYEQALASYKGNSFSGATDKALQQIGKTRKVVFSSQSFIILQEILQKTDLIAIVPKRLVSESENIHYLTPPIAIEGFQKTLIWHERIHRDPAYIWIKNLIISSVNHNEYTQR